MENNYTTNVNGSVEYNGPSLETAIRVWDQLTHNNPGAVGGITIQSWKDDVIVRDGYILHVEDGRVYLNPGLRDFA